MAPAIRSSYVSKVRNHKPSLLRRVADHPVFEGIVYTAIIINAILLANTAGRDDISCRSGVYIAEVFIFAIYLLECLI